MKSNIQSIPEGYSAITPFISLKNANKAIEFYKRALGAKEIGRVIMPNGNIIHAVIEIGGSKIMLAEENPKWGNVSQQTLGGSPVSICLYVNDVDAVFARAIKEGANVSVDREVKDQFYGDRSGTVIDPVPVMLPLLLLTITVLMMVEPWHRARFSYS